MSKWRKLIASSVVCLGLSLPTTALAASASDEEASPHDARTEGYQPHAQIESNSTALLWLLLAFMSVVALSVMFKNAKRTHLD